MMSIKERKKNAGSIEYHGREVGNHESVIGIPAGNEILSGTSHPGRRWCAFRVHNSRVSKHGRGGFLHVGGWEIQQTSRWGWRDEAGFKESEKCEELACSKICEESARILRIDGVLPEVCKGLWKNCSAINWSTQERRVSVGAETRAFEQLKHILVTAPVLEPLTSLKNLWSSVMLRGRESGPFRCNRGDLNLTLAKPQQIDPWQNLLIRKNSWRWCRL